VAGLQPRTPPRPPGLPRAPRDLAVSGDLTVRHVADRGEDAGFGRQIGHGRLG
jgi:hypothetical protein